MRRSSFADITDRNTRVLVLGSLPGASSLAAGQYYAHPRNRFWRLVGHAIGTPDLPAFDYDDRLAILRRAGIGLWDAVASAERAGSLDAALRRVEPAPLDRFVATLPRLRAVAFNGAAASRIGRRALAGSGLALIDLPSSSPANAGTSDAEKLSRWAILGDFLA